MRALLLSRIAVIALLAFGAACSDGDGGRESGEGAGATAVPGDAGLVGAETAVGAPSAATPAAGEPSDQHLYFAMSCAGDVLTITTTHETVYAELPCDRAVPADVAARFLGLPVRIRVVPSEPAKLYLESDTAGTVEFTVGRVWIEER